MKNLFYDLITNNMDETLDIEGRPLGEQRASKLYAKTETIRIQCNYPGSRFQNANPMNVSALKQIRQHKSEILYLFSKLRQQVCKSAAIERISYLEIWEIASQAILLPLFIKLKFKQKVPAYAAGLYKVAFGVISIAMKLTLKETLGEQLPVDPSYVFHCAEGSGELIGANEVCAAPEILIKEVIHSIIYGDSLDKKTNELNQWDIEGFLEFSQNSVRFQFCFISYLLYIRNLYYPFTALTNASLNKKYQSFQKSMKETQEQKPIPPVYQIESLVVHDDLHTFYRRLNKRCSLNKMPYDDRTSSNARIKHLKSTNIFFPEIKEEMMRVYEYEEQQLRTFNYLLNTAAKNLIEGPLQPLCIEDLEKAIGLSPFRFFTDYLCVNAPRSFQLPISPVYKNICL